MKKVTSSQPVIWGTVTSLVPFKQAFDLGIQIGWRVNKINDKMLTETTKRWMENILTEGKKCTITWIMVNFFVLKS